MRLFWQIIILISLFGCDTISKYQSQRLDEVGIYRKDYDKVIDYLFNISRHNFSYILTGSIRNISSKKITVDYKNVSLCSDIKEQVCLKLTRASKAMDMELGPEELVKLNYTFDGKPIMGFFHFVSTEAQDELFFKMKSVSVGGENIPISVLFKKY